MSSAQDLIPPRPSIPKLRRAAPDCRACPLWEPATQVVFGEGPARARLMLVGEVPGDQEDRQGAPFVGPAGRELDRDLETAGIARADAYLTNVVKHFKWRAGRGKRRIHQRPNAEEIRACRPWLDAELRVVKPEIVVLLGAVAAQALLGSGFKVTRERGRFLEPDFAPLALATVHPSSIVRIDDDDGRHAAREDFVRDLRTVARRLG